MPTALQCWYMKKVCSYRSSPYIEINLVLQEAHFHTESENTALLVWTGFHQLLHVRVGNDQGTSTFHHLVQPRYKTAWRPLATPAWLFGAWPGHLDSGEVATAAVRQQLAGNVEAPVAKLPPARYPQVEHLPTELDPHWLPVDVNLLVLLAQQHLPLRLLIVHLPV